MLRCESCHLAYASRMPTEATLDKFYLGYYDGKEERITFAGADRFAEHILRDAPLPPGARILDFGGGDGALSGAIARKVGGLSRVVDYGDSVPGGTWDLVIASAVLEHIPHPRPVLERLLAATGGVFYARTPWVLPLARCMPLDLTYPGHVHDMGQGFWDRLPDVVGWRGTVITSQPSLVETDLRGAPLRTIAAHVLKSPTRLWRRWPLVGGWEVIWRAGADSAESHQSRELAHQIHTVPDA